MPDPHALVPRTPAVCSPGTLLSDKYLRCKVSLDYGSSVAATQFKGGTVDRLSLGVLTSRIAAALTKPAPAGDAAAMITQAAVDLLPGVQSAAICLRSSPRVFEVIAPSDPLALEADRLQQQLGEGPALLALDTAETVSSSDVASDSRWPLYGPKVAASGFAAHTATPLQTSANSQAVLNLYSCESCALDDLGLQLELFTSHAAVAWCGALQLRDLGEALDRRKMIGQATGIIMERYGVAEEAAFAFLTRASQTGNVKLRQVASQIVAATTDRSRQQ